MINKIATFLKKDVTIEPSNSERIQNARERIDSHLESFNKLKNELVEVNNDLETIIVESKQKITSLNMDIESAEAEMKANKALVNRVEEFIK